MTRQEAQRRADRIRLFRAELADLEREGALALLPEQKERLERHLTATLAQLAAAFDVDTTETQKQVSWGMRIASTLGGLALCAGVVLAFYRYWGVIPIPAQVMVLALAPLVCLAGVEFASRRETTLYFTSLIALVAVAAFVYDLNLLGSIFNLESSPNAFLAWGIFAFAIAYRYGLRVPLAAGLIAAIIFLSATAVSWTGAWWEGCATRPEWFVLGGALTVAAQFAIPHRRFPEFAGAYRLVGLVTLYGATLVLSMDGTTSYLAADHQSVERLYQFVGLVETAATMWVGIRRGWSGSVNLAASAFVVFLYVRLVSWWWDWMPHYLFFLIIGLISMGLLVAFRRVRGSLKGARA